jgi:hypothetical protein
MTLAQAEAISSVVPEVVASRGSSGFCRRSQLGNWSLVEISQAFALMIAKNRQLVDQDPNARRLCKDYAEKAAAVLASLRMTVIHDAEADRLSKLDRDSAEYDEARRKLVISLLQDTSPEGQRFLKLESLESFNNYCWTLDAADSLYWKKVYDRLSIPFDEKAQVLNTANAIS